jgi:hypothetical protein
MIFIISNDNAFFMKSVISGPIVQFMFYLLIFLIEFRYLVSDAFANVFQENEEVRKKQKSEDKKRKELKKKRKEEEKAKAAQSNLFTDILQDMHAPCDGKLSFSLSKRSFKSFFGSDNGKSDNSDDAEPLIQAEPEMLKRVPKPGAKSVRWTDLHSAIPLESVREFAVDPNERGWLTSAEIPNFGLFLKYFSNPIRHPHEPAGTRCGVNLNHFIFKIRAEHVEMRQQVIGIS